MEDETLVTVPLVRVHLCDDADMPGHTKVRYFVGDVMIMDMSVEKAYVPSSPGTFPAMILTQLLVTPHQHLSVLSEFSAICAEIDPEDVPIAHDRWKSLLEQTRQLLNPPVDNS